MPVFPSLLWRPCSGPAACSGADEAPAGGFAALCDGDEYRRTEDLDGAGRSASSDGLGFGDVTLWPGRATGLERFAAGDGVLSVRHLKKSYRMRRIIEDVSMMVRRGEAVGLLGPNGAGKTTLFYMISGLIRPDAGAIELDGHDVTRLPMYRRARLGIGYLPQEPSIFSGLSVEDNIRAVLEITQHDRAQARARA